MPSKKKKSSLVSPTAAARELCLAKLKESGLTEADAKELKMEFLAPLQTAALGHDPVPSLKIPYFDPLGRPLSSWPKHPPMYRVRLFAPSGFEQMADIKEHRYSQPSGGSCAAYFPQNQKWDLLGDVTRPLIITEGELKAACACKFGYPTIGLGGVYNWKSAAHGIELLPELQAISWVGRNVYLCFDSDYMTNPMVCTALRQLAERLVAEGAFPYICTLPALPELAKTGLDDYLVAEGADAFGRVLHTAAPLGLTRVLFDYNEKYAVVVSPLLVINQQTFSKLSTAAFKDLESTRAYEMLKLDNAGNQVYMRVPAAEAWLSWPLRREAAQLSYRPGRGKWLEDGAFNTWPGWGCQPKKGDVKPFLQLIDHLFVGAEPEAKNWFLRWCAYPLQYPGTKMFCTAVFHGVFHGTGKTLVGRTLGLIYGKNYTSIGQDDLHTSFNQWAESRQFVMGDDVAGANKREDNDRLKKLITQTEIWINTKHVAAYSIPDCMNYFLNSNHSDAFFMDDKDRRYFIHEVIVDPLDRKFYQAYMDWLRVDRRGATDDIANGGAAAVFDYLLHLPMGDFDPFAPALRTRAKDRMIDTVQSDLGSWCRELRANPEHVLQVNGQAVDKDLFTNKELLMGFYDPLNKTKVTANGLGRALKDAGFRQVNDGIPLRLVDGSQDRYYAIRNAQKWLEAKPKDLLNHLHKSMTALTAIKKGGSKF